jgi:apolipoprotein N-acyltransferase
VWVALEFVRCHFLTGFPWYLLAHTQHNWLTMIQVTDLGGVFLVSLLVAAVNAIAFDIAYQFVDVRRWFNQSELAVERRYASVEVLNRGPFADWPFRRNLILEMVAVVLLLLGTYAYGVACLRHDRFATGPTVCLLQSNIDQRLREGIGGMKDPDQAFQTVESIYSELCVRATTNIQPKPDLVIWPETSFPSPWFDIAADVPAENVPTDWRDASLLIRKNLHDIGAKHTKVPHLLGVNSYILEADGKRHHYNSALLLNAKGEVEPNRFDKIHRVPFGEYIPLKDWLPFLAALSPYEGDFGVKPGEKMTRFEIKKYRFGVLICYEDTDPFLARRYVEDNADGPPVDFLVNISNDGWFDGSAEHEEHLAVSRFRAIECRRSMVRAVNMGVSAVIDPNGRVMKPVFYEGSDAPLKGTDKPSPPVFILKEENGRVPSLQLADWKHFKKRQMVIAASVPIDNRASLYSMTGDVLPITCWAALIGTTAWAFARRRQAKPLTA